MSGGTDFVKQTPDHWGHLAGLHSSIEDACACAQTCEIATQAVCEVDGRIAILRMVAIAGGRSTQPFMWISRPQKRERTGLIESMGLSAASISGSLAKGSGRSGTVVDKVR